MEGGRGIVKVGRRMRKNGAGGRKEEVGEGGMVMCLGVREDYKMEKE